MKKSRWMIAMSFGILAFVLALSVLAVPSALARPYYPSDGSEPAIPDKADKAAASVYDPAAFTANWGVSPDMLISCDPDNELLAQIQPGSVRSSHSLQAAVCTSQAAEEAKAASVDFSSAASGGGSCGYSGVSADGRDIKVYSVSTSTRYVYLQCGKKVGTFGPPTCSCSANSRYTYDCKKPPTVYITLPCHH